MLGSTILGLNSTGTSSVLLTPNEIPITINVANPATMTFSYPPTVSFITLPPPDVRKYEQHIMGSIRCPTYKIEFLRQENESPYLDVSDWIICDSGSVNIEKQNGVRRTSSFELSNIGKKFNDFVEHLTIGSKFRVSIGEEIDGNTIYFNEGVFLCDDPTVYGGNGDCKITISGTDKWSVLNGQHGGVLEGTYTVEKGSTVGDFIRRTLRLNIVNDPITPLIHSDVESKEITYDITKSEGSTIADVFLDVALNMNLDMFYDEHGRLNVVPIAEAENRTIIRRFAPEDYSYISASKTYNNERICNSVLVVGENAANSNSPVRFELVNNDPDDPNSVVNVGVKKVYKVSEYTSGIDTEEKARWRAAYELRNIREKFFSANIEYVDVMHLDVDQIVELRDSSIPGSDDDDCRYVIVSLNHNLGVDLTVTASVSKI